MSRIFIFDDNHDTIQTMRYALESQGHDIYANLVLKPGEPSPRLVKNVVDVVGLLVGLRPFPDLVIAETDSIDGAWLGGLIYDMELGQNCSLILMGREENEKIKQLKKLYGAHFWAKPFNVMTFVNYIETFLAITC